MVTRPLELRHKPLTLDDLRAQWEEGEGRKHWATSLEYAQFANRNYLAPPHIQLLNGVLTKAAREGNARIIVLMPPRHGKSELCSHYFPAWYLLEQPTQPIILASYEADFAMTWGRKVRTEIQEHGAEAAVYLRSDSTAAGRWETTQGGGMVTVGVGGPITGRGAKILVIDDPVKNAEEADSATYRDKTWEWFLSTAYTRLEPGGSIILIMTHWHEDDLAGRLIRDMKAGGEAWEVISLPAVAEENDPLGRAVGEPLWPERFDTEALELRRLREGAHWWAALYQQRPTAREGGLWKWAWIDRVDELPQLQRVVVAVDPAGSTTKNSDETGICVAAKGIDAQFYILVCRGYRTSPNAWATKTWELFDSWHADRVLGESNFGGDMVESTLRSVRRHGPITMVKASRGKVLRAEPIASLYEQGVVHHFRAQEDLEDQMVAFPNATYDDLVDAMVYALTDLATGGYEADEQGFGQGASARIGGF